MDGPLRNRRYAILYDGQLQLVYNTALPVFSTTPETNLFRIIRPVSFIYSDHPGSWIDRQKSEYHYSELTGIGEHHDLIGMAIFPNPANACIRINLSGSATISEITIADMHGRTCRRIVFKEPSSTVSADVVGLPEGVYLIHCQRSDGMVRSGRFILAR